MPGPVPKDPSARSRRNKTSTRATLSSDGIPEAERPEIPERPWWHPMARQWWESVWASPMASEYVEADHEALYRLLLLVHDFWIAETPSDRIKVSAEIRLQQVNFGLTPYDRRRLEWSIESAEESKDRGRRRRHEATAPAPSSKPGAPDPRAVLRAVQ